MNAIQTAPEDPGAKAGRLDERKLLIRHLQGDSSAFRELVACYRRPVYGFLVRSGVDAETRDELFQEIFLKVHKGAKSYQPGRPLKPWLFTIAANTVRSYFRSQKNRYKGMDSQSVEEIPDPRPGGHDAAVANETAQWLEAALEELPLMQRQVILLCCVEKMEQKDVAEVLELPVNTVKTHLRRGRLALARALSRRANVEGQEVAL